MKFSRCKSRLLWEDGWKIETDYSYDEFLGRYKDLGINGLTARWHDRNSHHHRIDELRSYAREVTKHVEKSGFVLEIAPGPGYMAIELAKSEFKNFNTKEVGTGLYVYLHKQA